MKTFKTKAGTELPLLDLRGKDYLLVPNRVRWMREERPDWSIETEIIERNEQYAICKATIKNEAGRIIATAHKREDIKHFLDNIEKAETSAIGRALALCGYGTQFAPEFDEGDRIVDAPLESKKVSSVAQQAPSQRVTTEGVTVKSNSVAVAGTGLGGPAPLPNNWSPGKKEKDAITNKAERQRLPLEEVVKYMRTKFGVDKLALLSRDQYFELDAWIEGWVPPFVQESDVP